MKNNFIYVFFTLILSSCASSFHTVNPQNVFYQSSSNQDNVSFSYKYEVLHERGNKKYAKKEAKKGIKLVVVKVENN
ncbi:MAG: hypothetical protein KTR26_08655 [Flammeovirgaceae bacterium]|nr:hypothetical protein [Flammeovirgaceae bacterium]